MALEIRFNETVCAGEKCIADAVEGKFLCAACKKKRNKQRLISAPGYSWIFLAQVQGKIRIAHATNLNLALGSLRDSNPSPLQLLIAFEGVKEIAAEIREKFAADQFSGRWFNKTNDIEAFVKLIEKGYVKKMFNEATGRVLKHSVII